MPDSQTKPSMTRREANWHAHVAGMRAAEAASEGDPAAADALMEGSAPSPTMVAGFHMPPLTIAVFWALRDVARAGEIKGIESQIISLMAFLDPDAVRDAAKKKDIDWLVEEAYKISRKLTPSGYADLAGYIADQMEALRNLGGSPDDAPTAPVGKPPVASSAAD